jgi:hypothetical protein
MTETPLDRLPPDVRALADSIIKLLMLYMPGQNQVIEFLVGRDVKASLKFSGGPITQEVISDTLAHLSFYKKYFPKDGVKSPAIDTPEKILSELASKWELHRKMLPKQIEH